MSRNNSVKGRDTIGMLMKNQQMQQYQQNQHNQLYSASNIRNSSVNIKNGNQRGNNLANKCNTNSSTSSKSAVINKNKENLNNSLTKIFLNSPRCKPTVQDVEQFQIDSTNYCHQYIGSVLKSNNQQQSEKKSDNNTKMLNKQQCQQKQKQQQQQQYAKINMSDSQTSFTPVNHISCSSINQVSSNTNNNNSNKKNNNFPNSYQKISAIKSSLVLTKNINLKESNINYNNNNNLNSSQSSSRSIRQSQSKQLNTLQSIKNQMLSSSDKNTINSSATNRPASSSQAERQSKLSLKNNSNNNAFSITQKSKEERQKGSSAHSSRKSLENSLSKHFAITKNSNNNDNLNDNTSDTSSPSSSQRPSTKTRMSTNSQSNNNMQVKSQNNFTASKKLLTTQTIQLAQSTTLNSPISNTTKVNNFIKSFSNQPSSKFNSTTSKALYQNKSDYKLISNNINSNCDDSIQDDNNKCKDELKEYQKLQEKLTYLETKILNIKTNYDTNYQKEKEIQSSKKQMLVNNDNHNDSQQNLPQQLQQNIPKMQSSPTNIIQSSQQISTLNTDRLKNQPLQQTQSFSAKNIENAVVTLSSQHQQQSISLYQQLDNNRISDKSTITPVTCTDKESEYDLNSGIMSPDSTNQISSSNIIPQTDTQQSIQRQQQQQYKLLQEPQKQQQQQQLQQYQKSQQGGLSSLITQVTQSCGVPFGLGKQKGESNSTKSSTTQLQTIKHSSTQYQLKKLNTNNSINTSISKQNLSSTIKTPKQSQLNTQNSPTSNSNSSSSAYRSFAFKTGISTYSQQYQLQKSIYNSANSNQLSVLQIIDNNNQQQQECSKNENVKIDIAEQQQQQQQIQEQRQSIQILKNSSMINQMSTLNQIQQQQCTQIQQSQKLYYVSSIISAYSNSYDSCPLKSLARDHLLQTMQSIQFAKCISLPSNKIIESKKVYFNPLKDNKKTLIFDLDETLIHCNENINIPSDVIVPIVFPTGEVLEAGINVRPYAIKILEELSQIYEIVIFTASHSCYANVVLDYLDPERRYISYRLFRDHCVQTDDGVYVKDLRVIGNRNMSDMIIVDNAAYSFGFQIHNGLPIIPFYDNKDDLELKYLINYMKSIQHVKDFRDINQKLLKVSQYSEYIDPIHLLESLYPEHVQI